MRQTLGLSLPLGCFKFTLRQLKGLGVVQTVKEINFGVAWGKLESKKCYPRQ